MSTTSASKTCPTGNTRLRHFRAKYLRKARTSVWLAALPLLVLAHRRNSKVQIASQIQRSRLARTQKRPAIVAQRIVQRWRGGPRVSRGPRSLILGELLATFAWPQRSGVGRRRRFRRAPESGRAGTDFASAGPASPAFHSS